MGKFVTFILLTVFSLNVRAEGKSSSGGGRSAFLSLRAHAGFEIIDPESLNDYLSSQDIKQIYLMPRLGFAALLRPWSAPVSLGVIYDEQNIKVNSSNGQDNWAKLNAKRLAGKLHWHVVDKPVFTTGPVVEVGFRHQLRLEGENTAGPFKYNQAEAKSFLAGWEWAFLVNHFIIGGDLGYMRHIYEGIKDENNNEATFRIDMSGFSFTIFSGIGF